MISPDIFKANDIRGVVGQQWDAAGARQLGRAWVTLMRAHRMSPQDSFVIGRDMRTSSEELVAAFTAGAMEAGGDVIDIGLASTDQLWFASGHLDLPGVMFTASHNPAEYNGIKFCRAAAAPVTSALIEELRDLVGSELPVHDQPGTHQQRDLLGSYAARLHSLVALTTERQLRVVVDAGNGMAGHTMPAVLEPLGLEIIGLYTELDGTFPHHPANPLEPENLVDAQRAVRENGADLGLVFDGDADRCFIIDECGDPVDPSAITAMIAEAELQREPGATIVVNTITSACVRDVVTAAGGSVVTSRVGHTYVKAAMADHDAIFGGEHSAHYYFRDFWGADTGMLAALQVIAMLSRTSVSLSELVERYQTYARSGEINSTVDDIPATVARVSASFADRGEITDGDGVTVAGDGWVFNLRGSNTEPLLRLNVEATTAEAMVAVRDEVLGLVRGEES